ncbi:MAG: type II secretion system F family protein [Alphaproteobacteria bacterium]|nr:type II secretion system F family protein [Alphaproteobacteria bacterium]
MNKPTKKAVIRPVSSFEIAFAKMMFCYLPSSSSDRIALYNKLRSLLKNRFSLMDALERIYQIASKDGKSPYDTNAIAISCWMKSIRNGDPFSVALKGWAPNTELLMLSVGDVANLESALENTVRVVEGIKRMKSAVMGAVLYPLFLISMVFFLIWGVGAYMVPPMVDAVPHLRWTGLSLSLVNLSIFVQEHPLFLFGTLPLIVTVVTLTFPRWKKDSRALADKMPPWSIYRIFVGVGWLLSLSALVSAGTPVSKAMRSLRHDASPYLLYRIDSALKHVNNGDNIGDALYKTGLGFPDEEVIGDLRIYSELDNFTEALERLSVDWMEDSINSVAAKAAALNGIAILMIAAVICWVVAGTFDMQEQMVNGMGLGAGR